MDCKLLETGTEGELLDACRRALESGKPGGGYFFCTSNSVYQGVQPSRYEAMNAFWRAHRAY